MIIMYSLIDFFKGDYERTVNEKMFYRNFVLEDDHFSEYVKQILYTSYVAFLKYVITLPIPSYLIFQDVVQYSSLDDATNTICCVLSQSGDKGESNLSIGKLLLNDGVVRNDMAYSKYGENHAKTAMELGLVQRNSGYYFLTALGEAYNDLSEENKFQLIRRTVLRNRFTQKILIKAQSQPVDLASEMSFFSEKTIRRRLPNVKGFLRLITCGTEEEASFLSNVDLC